MRLGLLVLLAVLSLPLPAFAFKARVVDQQRRPVAGATVSILGRTGVMITALGAEPELVVTIAPLLNESVTVSGSAPSITSSPAAGTTTISGRDLAVRQPSNLMQALENVAGVNQVSEGQAAVPAIRGLARGRTLILIDGARVSSERRAGPSATFMDSTVKIG